MAVGDDEKIETNEDGQVVNKFSSTYVNVAMTVLRYFTMLLLYGGIITVICGLFVMTPETASAHGSSLMASHTVSKLSLATTKLNASAGPQALAQSAGEVVHLRASASEAVSATCYSILGKFACNLLSGIV